MIYSRIDKKKTYSTTSGENLELATRQRDHYRIAELRQKKEIILKYVTMFECRSRFEKPSVVMSNKTHNKYELFWLEQMHVFDLAISRRLKNVCNAHWRANG